MNDLAEKLATATAAETLILSPASPYESAEMFSPSIVVPKLEVPDAEIERSRREHYLDRLHARQEADPLPKAPGHISLVPSDRGPRINFRLDSLKNRKKRTPSERERLLGLQLAGFLIAGGL